MTDKDLIRNFVAEVKQRNFLKELFKRNTIEFENYFKRSTKTIDEVDPTVGIGETHRRDLRLAYLSQKVKDKHIYTVVNKEDSLIIDYFYRNPNQTMQKMAEELGVCKGKVIKVMNRNLDRGSW